MVKHVFYFYFYFRFSNARPSEWKNLIESSWHYRLNLIPKLPNVLKIRCGKELFLSSSIYQVIPLAAIDFDVSTYVRLYPL